MCATRKSSVGLTRPLWGGILLLVFLCTFRPVPTTSDNSKEKPTQEGAMIATKHTNRLIESVSPYLLQHAHNPVDWYPWSDDALKRAKE